MIRVLEGDCRAVLPTLPAASVQCVVTSPPYFGLRDYGTAQWAGGDLACNHQHETKHQSQGATSARVGRSNAEAQKSENFRDKCPMCGAVRVDRQIGLEASPDAFVAEMVAVFREVRRVLRDDGTLWLNLGDSYAGSMKGSFKSDDAWQEFSSKSYESGNTLGQRARTAYSRTAMMPSGYKPKDLMMIPARVALALQADGWWLRSDIIWSKPNPMPESVTDRPTSAHEHVFLLTKSARYFYDADAVREDATSGREDMAVKGLRTGLAYIEQGPLASNSTKAAKRVKVPGGWDIGPGAHGTMHRNDRTEATYQEAEVSPGRNMRNVWTIATAPFPEAHFATFPPALAERCIKAGTSERGCCSACGAPWVRQVERETVREHAPTREMSKTPLNVVRAGWREGGPVSTTTGWSPSCECGASVVPCTVLDPFAGAFTSLLVADRLQRHGIGIELNPAYAAMARNRLTKDAGMFADLSVGAT